MSALRELPLVVIVGPTASGKSLLAVWLARQLDGEVLACDSTQLYRGFDIGTAKPGVEEKSGVPHHLIDLLEGSEETTAGAYRERAIAVLSDLRDRNKLPILTAGTGLYLLALLEGFADVPQRSLELRERLRANAAGHGPGYLHRILDKLDPVSAQKIAAADEQKLIRAIEVCLLAKQPLSRLYRTGRKALEGWRAIKIGLNPARESLYQRIHARTDAMLDRGWLDEVRGLAQSAVPESAKPFDFIGYRELRKVLTGEMRLQDARDRIQQATRRYAKRQLTWFRREPNVQWLQGFGNEAQVQRAALEWIRSAL
jgi:tRNA dimethylallyltransferase